MAQMLSGVWPGVSMNLSVTLPNSSVSPSCMGVDAYAAWPRAPKWISASKRSRNARWLVTVDVGQQHVLDRGAGLGCIRDVFADVALRVDDDRQAGGLVDEKVGGVR